MSTSTLEKPQTTTFNFNLLLTAHGIDPEQVKLYRHADKEKNGRLSTEHSGGNLFDGWKNHRDDFEKMQACHTGDYFSKREYAAFFIRAEGQSIFTGLYRVVNHQKKNDGLSYYTFEKDPRLKDLEGKLFVQWETDNPVKVDRNADKLSLPIAKYSEELFEPDFPGYDAFQSNLNDITTLPESWKSRLQGTKGIYLLTCCETGYRYVGAAYGENGFLGRWLTHQVKEGDAKLLYEHKTSGYTVTILDIMLSSEDDAIIQRESFWKNKLMTRRSQHPFGLNDN